MNVFVIATASRASGALVIYKQFIEQLATRIDNDHYFVFVDPSMPQPNIPQVQYVVVNTRGLRRVFFDFFGFRCLTKQLGISPDWILSFQNTCVRGTNAKQIVYFHNALSLIEVCWNPFKRNERTLFFYTSLYPHYLRLLLKRDVLVVVQANFIKRMFVRRFRIPEQQIHVIRPTILKENGDEKQYTQLFDSKYYHFIYPATDFCYKNHAILLQALVELQREKPEMVSQIKLHFTLREGINKVLQRQIEDNGLSSNIEFLGLVSHTHLQSMYRQATALLFPSWIETLGLPLVEAASYGLPIIACDEAYAHEALDGYEGVEYVAKDDVIGWKNAIERRCNMRIRYPLFKPEENNSWDILFNILQ